MGIRGMCLGQGGIEFSGRQQERRRPPGTLHSLRTPSSPLDIWHHDYRCIPDFGQVRSPSSACCPTSDRGIQVRPHAG
jgi:hypothetical protein